jgi:hypothetical protein
MKHEYVDGNPRGEVMAVGSFRFPGSVCRSRITHQSIDDGTLARVRSPVPSVTGCSAARSFLTLDPAFSGPVPGESLQLTTPGLSLSSFQSRVGLLSGSSALAGQAGSSAAVAPVKSRTRPTARGQCVYLNPETYGRVKVPLEAFEHLRKKSGPTQISAPKVLENKKAWPKASEWPDALASSAIYQEIVIDGQKIRVVRPSDQDMRGKILPTIEQLAEALRAVPADQRQHTTTALVRLQSKGGVLGLGGSGEIEIFPLDSSSNGKEREQHTRSPQAYFDNLVTHECAHNYQATFWKDAGGAKEWEEFAKNDHTPPSIYARENGGEDFCEFMVLYNAAAGTPCEALLKQIYPNRWLRFTTYKKS